MEEIKKKLKSIEDTCDALLSEQRETSNIPSIPLDGLLDVLEMRDPTIGVQCRSEDCVFNVVFGCGLKRTFLRKGQCRYYNTELKAEDLIREL